MSGSEAGPDDTVLGPPATGQSYPLGASLGPGGVNFSVYSRNATGLDLLLFDAVDDLAPSRVVSLDPRGDRTADYWHVFVPGLRPGQLYAFRATGPWAPEAGQRFDASAVLLDPHGRAVAVPAAYRRRASGPPGSGATDDPLPAMKSAVADLAAYDWEGDRPIGRPFRETVIYEAHLRGFTADASSGVESERRGTYAGFIEKIPYLQALGVTAVELLPVFQFDRLAAPAGRTNHWGYQPISFFAPHGAYSSRPGALAAVDEFRDLVKALHRAGLEVILDVVFNHTAEGGGDGPTFAFRGLANDAYYILEDDRSRYADYTGTGNTLNANHPVVRALIRDSLRHWVREMHVDGFRFDLAAVLSRDESGRPMSDPPTLWDIDKDPVLAGTKLIAEAWDAGGLYQVGSFVGDRWVEWNGRFRDDARAFVKGDPGLVRTIGQRITGSPDIYGARERDPQQGVNFVTCHDGFTLNDLVSYDAKHNEANGEGNRDGTDQNLSWNCGVEGPSDDPEVERLRERQMKNLLTIELISVGVPMLLMGDEVRRTQAGNNNGYCLDDPSGWFDWTGVERHATMLRFVTKLVDGRRGLSRLLDLPQDVTLLEMLESAAVEWSGVRIGEPDLGDASRSLALTVRGGHIDLHLILNAYWEALDFELPPGPDGPAAWRRIVDTSLDSPDDVVEMRAAIPIDAGSYRAGPRSTVVLAKRAAPDPTTGRRPR